MNRYTFLIEYRGGTYIRQVESADIDTAILLWARNLDIKGIKYWGESSKTELIQRVEQKDIYAVAITDLKNVWSLGGTLLRTGIFFANVVASRI